MAKDTEKLIRQLSLISYLMAERRPVTASEIRRDVEGYSGMNEDAFARRFYADRAELEALGIHLSVDKPAEANADQENYSLRPENFHLPAIEFSDQELAALGSALMLLDGEFAYAEPLRLALQQLTWGQPSPLNAPDQRQIALGVTAGAEGPELSQRLAKIETAIFRQKTILFDYFTIDRDHTEKRKVDPYALLFQDGRFYLVGYAHEREAVRVFRLSRIRGRVSYASKSEHDFRRPADFDPRDYANRAAWQLGDPVAEAEIDVSKRIAWQIERHFGRYGQFEPLPDGGLRFATSYSSARALVSWVLRHGEHLQIVGPPELEAELQERVGLLARRHTPGGLELAASLPGTPSLSDLEPEPTKDKAEPTIRPERFARLVTLASILIQAGRRGEKLQANELQQRLQITEAELRDDVNLLSVVNFGGGSYVLYAEVAEDGTIEVDPEPYSDNFARPARLLPVEAKALVAAIDLIGDHLRRVR
ncbi:MAG: WYL domain-containing protein [Patulibacter minatonensis]